MRLLCLNCGGETSTSETLAACPACGDSEHTPADLDDTATVTLTVHELRILTMWADNWARHVEGHGARNTVRVICDRLGTQTAVPLTLSQEIADLRARFGGVQAPGCGEAGL